jgi:hypothetical protein
MLYLLSRDLLNTSLICFDGLYVAAPIDETTGRPFSFSLMSSGEQFGGNLWAFGSA